MALTMLELIVIVAVVGLLLALLLSALSKAGSQKPSRCITNLKNIGLAARVFATSHGDKFPAQVSTNHGGCAELVGDPLAVQRYFQCLSNELPSLNSLICPFDERKPTKSFESLKSKNLSYFIGWDADETLPQMLLAGDRVFFATNGWVNLSSNTPMRRVNSGLHGPGTVVLGDGSVQQLNVIRLRQFTGSTNRLVIP